MFFLTRLLPQMIRAAVIFPVFIGCKEGTISSGDSALPDVAIGTCVLQVDSASLTRWYFFKTTFQKTKQKKQNKKTETILLVLITSIAIIAHNRQRTYIFSVDMFRTGAYANTFLVV